MHEENQPPCINRCVKRGTENNDEPTLLIARHGAYCDKCHDKIDKALELAPNVVEHVVSLIESKGSAGEKVDGKADAAPLPFNAQAFDDANETYKALVYWSSECAAILGVQPPTPSVFAWRNRKGTIMGLSNRVAPNQARYITGVMATWLRMHLDAILSMALPEFVDDLTDQLRDVYRINARWPQKARARYSDMPCPVERCGQRLAVFPPDNFGEDEHVVCDRGHHIPPNKYEFYINFFTQLQAEKDPVKRHLLKKYGRIA